MSRKPREDADDEAENETPPKYGQVTSGSPSLAWRDVFAEVESGLRRFLSAKLPQPADVDDCMQSVTMAMLRNKTDIPAAARRAWLFRVAANEAALWWRKKATTDRVMESVPGTPSAIDSTPPTQLEFDETRLLVHRAIERLPETTRTIVRMRIRDGKTFRQIASELNIPIGTALTRMRRAMEQLRIDLRDLDHRSD